MCWGDAYFYIAEWHTVSKVILLPVARPYSLSNTSNTYRIPITICSFPKQAGVLLLSSEHSEGLISRFGPVAEKENHQLIPIEFGTLNQLRNLVHLVSTGEVRIFQYSPWSSLILLQTRNENERENKECKENELAWNSTELCLSLFHQQHLYPLFQIEPPPHTIFSADQANEALAKIGRGIIPGRAILEFPDEESEE